MTRAPKTKHLLVACIAVAMLLPGCAMMAQPTGTITREAAVSARGWRSVATDADRRRIGDWRGAWMAGLTAARAAGNAAAISSEGALLNPDAALPDPALPVGDYHCRIIKLGNQGGGPAATGLAYVAYPRFLCRVAAERGIFSFAKLTGSQRPVGLIFADDGVNTGANTGTGAARRTIFLGTLMLGDESRALDYGSDPARDVAGVVERIGPARWRMIMPRPAFESNIDVMELIPVA